MQADWTSGASAQRCAPHSTGSFERHKRQRWGHSGIVSILGQAQRRFGRPVRPQHKCSTWHRTASAATFLDRNSDCVWDWGLLPERRQPNYQVLDVVLGCKLCSACAILGECVHATEGCSCSCDLSFACSRCPSVGSYSPTSSGGQSSWSGSPLAASI